MVNKVSLKPALILQITRNSIRLLTLISPFLAARLVNYLWFKTHRFTEPKREQKVLQTARWQTLKIENNEIQLYIWGENNLPTVLLVHGWNGRAAQLGAFAQDLAEQGCRVIGFDAPGHGRSSANNTNLPAISRVIKMIVSEYGPFRAGISHSFGGLCLIHALTEGAEISKVVCIASPSTVERMVIMFAKKLQIQANILDRHMRLLEQQFGLDIWQRFSMPNMINKLTIPGLIIHDKDDDDVPVIRGEEIARSWKNSELVVTSGLGHRRILGDKAMIKKVTQFIKAA